VSYAVHEIFLTLQGEGTNTGRLAVFCRFSGCNLWNGLERDRARALCRFCDTEFVGVGGPGGGRFESAAELAAAVWRRWPAEARQRPFTVLTGGEPLLQVDAALIADLHRHGLEVAVETNGTLQPPVGLDWVCVSPKARAPLRVHHGDELKLVHPQAGLDPESFEQLGFDHFLLQPMDGPDLAANTKATAEYCREHPRWKLSLQTHKLMGIP
jgi:7-carboxy-7-deazaguanine synthase (Cx14CxxC type)